MTDDEIIEAENVNELTDKTIGVHADGGREPIIVIRWSTRVNKDRPTYRTISNSPRNQYRELYPQFEQRVNDYLARKQTKRGNVLDTGEATSRPESVDNSPRRTNWSDGGGFVAALGRFNEVER